MITTDANGLTIYLYYDYRLNLEEFSIAGFLTIETGRKDHYSQYITVAGNWDRIDVIYNKGDFDVVVSAQIGDAEFKGSVLDDFNNEVNEKFIDKIEDGKISIDEIREYLNALLDYVNKLTDSRAQDWIEKIKEETKGEISEPKVEDVVEAKEEEEIEE